MKSALPERNNAMAASAPRTSDSRLPDFATWPLAKELPYLCSCTHGNIGPLHVLADDTLGFAFEVDVPVVDTVPDGEVDFAGAVLTMLHAVPPQIHWQWFVQGRPCVEEQLALYQRQPGEDAAGRLFADALVSRWRVAQFQGFFPAEEEINLFPRRHRIVIALKSPPLGLCKSGVASAFQALMPEPVQRLISANRHDTPGKSPAGAVADRFAAAVGDVLASAHANGWTTRAVDANGLVAWLIDLLFPQRALEPSEPGVVPPVALRAFPDGEEARNAIAAAGRIEDICTGGFCSISRGRSSHHRIVSMLWQPRMVTPGMLNFLSGLRPSIGICLCATPVETTKALLQLKARALLNARSAHRFNQTEMQARNEALEAVERRLFADGEKIFTTRLQVHITEADARTADQVAAMVAKHMEALEIECTVESEIGSSLLLRGCLPFTIYPEAERKFRRSRRLLSRDCADIHPGGGSWTGVSPLLRAGSDQPASPIVMYCNPTGEPLFIDPTKAEKNPHALVVGQSGSGKSFFVHDYLLHLWRLPNVRLFLISIKADYRKLALLLGKYVEIHLDSDISLNPFCGQPSLENQARWTAALSLMLADGSKEGTLTREAEIALLGAALSAAQRNWDAELRQPMRETILEDICLELERLSNPIGRQLAARLQPYRKGPYRRIFNAPRGIKSSDRFVFFNLGNILAQPCAAVVSFCVFGMVDEVMNDPSQRAVPKGLIADEVWALVRNPYAAAILERSLKAYRSLGGFAIPIVQDPHDLDTPSGRVMLVNTATKVILPMDRSGRNDLARYVQLNERETEIVRNLRLVKRRYSEFFVSIDGMRSTKGILIPDPLRYAVATTDPADEDRIDRLYRERGSMLEAVREFARRSPYGIASQFHEMDSPSPDLDLEAL